MNRRFSILAVAVVAVFAIALGQAMSADSGKEITELSKQIAVASVDSNTEFLEGSLSDDWAIVTPGGRTQDKDELIGEMKHGMLTFESIKDAEVRVNIYGDAVILRGVRRIKINYRGEEVSGPTRFTEVFIRRQGKWQCVSTHLTASKIGG